MTLGIDESLSDTVAPGLKLEIEDIGSFVVESASPHKGGLLVHFRGIEDRDEAKRVAGHWVRVARENLPGLSEGQFYDFELLGAEVRNSHDGTTLGTVREVIVTGANDVYRAEGPRGELLIPAVGGVVIAVDTEAGLITVDPDGLVGPATGEARPGTVKT